MEFSFDKEKAKGLKSLSWVHFITMSFMLTSGSGPFGSTGLIRTGGPLLSVVGYFVSLLVFVLPQALMCAEMGSMIPTNYGFIAWVYRGWGDIPGYIAGVNGIAAGVIDLGLYPLLIAAHINHMIGNTLPPIQIFMIRVGVVIAGLLISSVPMKEVGRVSLGIVVITGVPILAASFARLPYLDPITQWSAGPPHGDTPRILLTFVLTLLWNQNGYDRVGSFAGEMNFDASLTMQGFLVVVLLNFFLGWVPFFMALTLPYNPSEWSNGFMSLALGRMLGPGMDKLFGACAVLLIFWLYVVLLSQQARMVMTMAHEVLEIKMRNESVQVDLPGTIDGPSHFMKETYMIIPIRALPSVFGQAWSTSGAPVPAAIFISVIVTVLSLLNFSLIVNIEFALTSIVYILEFSTFYRMRWTEPDAVRPSRVPGGFLVASLLAFMTVFLSVFVLVASAIFRPLVGATAIGFDILIALLRFFVWSDLKATYVERFNEIETEKIETEKDYLLGAEW